MGVDGMDRLALQALGVVGFLKRRIRLGTPTPPDHRVRLPLAADLDLGEHLRIFHDMPVPNPSQALHARLHQAVGFGRATLAVPHYHSAELSAEIHATEEARAEAELAWRRARVGLPVDFAP